MDMLAMCHMAMVKQRRRRGVAMSFTLRFGVCFLEVTLGVNIR